MRHAQKDAGAFFEAYDQLCDYLSQPVWDEMADELMARRVVCVS